MARAAQGATPTNLRQLRPEDTERPLSLTTHAPVDPPPFARTDHAPAVSVVAPCYNEETVLPLFVTRMVAACESLGVTYEVLLVNDGSRDGTWGLIEALATDHPRIVGINLSRNHGHQLAVTAGLSLARGERVLIIDADLQDPPELLGDMMRLCDEGSDVVYGRRRSRPQESRFKLASAGLFYRLLSVLSDVDIPRDVGDFRLMNRRTVERLNAMPEQDRFIRGMVAWLGGRQTEILYDREPRAAGETGYTVAKMVQLASSALTSFSTVPLKVATMLAFLGVLLGFGIMTYALIGFFLGRVNTGWTSLALMLVTFGIAQLGCLGIVGSYVGRIYKQVKGRPLFMIDEVTAPHESPVPGLDR
jgi:polyisoprenyl-phosphate glycosyltransferase